MQALLDSLVIETYTQLAVVLAVIVTAVAGSALVLRRRVARRRSAVKLIAPQHRPAAQKSEQQTPQVRKAKGMDFDRLADMIADANGRAGHISETQSAVALKLDTAEMAVNRLIADIDPVMSVPKTVRPAAAENASSTPRSTIAA